MSTESPGFPLSTAASAPRRIDADALANRLSGLGVEISTERAGSVAKICVVRVDAKNSFETLTRLRDDESFSMRRLVDLTGIDLLGRAPDSEPRFAVSYQLYSPTNQQRLRVEVSLRGWESSEEGGEEPTLESVTKLWPAANWLAREVFDLFGIRFRGHPELRRILLDDDFEGAPLRKDHPLEGERSRFSQPGSSTNLRVDGEDGGVS